MIDGKELTLGQARTLKAVMSGLFHVTDPDRETLLRKFGIDAVDLEWTQRQGCVTTAPQDDKPAAERRLALTDEGHIALLASIDAGTIIMRDPNDRIWISVLLAQAGGNAAADQLTSNLAQALQATLDRLDRTEDLTRLAASKLDRTFSYAWSIEQERDAAIAAGHLSVNPKSYPKGFESAYAFDYKTEAGIVDLLRTSGFHPDPIVYGEEVPLPGLLAALPANAAVRTYDPEECTVTLSLDRIMDLEALVATVPSEPAVSGYKSNCKLDCLNYEGAIEDCNEAVRQMIRLLNGETTAERTREWVRLNYPKLSGAIAPASINQGDTNA